MTPTERNRPGPAEPARCPWADLLLFAALVIVGLRPLIQETHDSRRTPFAAVLSELPEIGPLPTLWIDVGIVILFGGTVLLRRRGRLPTSGSTGLGIGAWLLGAAAAGSCLVASNQRLALNATLDWITLVLLALALTWLLRRPWQQRLLLGVIVASGVASAIESFDQIWVSFPATLAEYERDPTTWWAQSGSAPPSYQVALFEKRLRENAARGFFSMSNVAGGYLVLTGFAALGLARCSRGRPVAAALLTLPTAALAGAALLTRSRGALLAGLAGLAAIAGLCALRRFTTTRPRAVFAIACLGVVAGLAGITTCGLTTGKLPGGSLTYRWWYLEASARMVRDHPGLGVGTAQYGRYYPRYKEIKSPEEIANPHNFLAQAAAEWGLGGLAGMILLCWGAARRICLPGPGIAPSSAPDSVMPRPLLWVALLTATTWLLQVWITGHRDPWIIVGRNAYACCGWVLTLLLCCTAVGSVRPTPESRCPAAVAVIGVGLAAFLLHNLISFSLFVPGSACTAFALLAVCLAARLEATGPPPPGSSRARSRSAPAVAAAMIVLIGGIYGVLIQPVSRAWNGLQRARSLRSTDPRLAADTYTAALHADRLDPTAAREWLEQALSRTPPEPDILGRFAGLCPPTTNPLLDRDPEDLGGYRLSAQVALSDFLNDPADAAGLRQAARFYREVLRRYPSNPEDHVRMSEIEYLSYQHAGDPAALDRAISELRGALDLNDRRDPDEIRRFSAATVQQLRGQIEALEARRLDHP